METTSQPKFCLICKQANETQSLACVYCGAIFVDVSSAEYETKKDAPSRRATDELAISGSLNVPSKGMAFFLFGKTKPIAVLHEDVIYLGRAERKTREAFVDLSLVSGFDMGVSRQHAMIQRQENRVEIMDLHSSNGTFLNGNRILPEKFYLLTSGTVIQLGHLKLVAIYSWKTDH